MQVRKPTWSSASFLIYLGGFTVLAAASTGLSTLRGDYGDAGYVGWTALVFAVLSLLAYGFKKSGEWLVAGVFAFATVISFGVFFSALLSWWGWLASPDHAFDGFHVSLLLLAGLVWAAAAVTIGAYAFPLLVAIEAAAGWYFVVDLVSGGGGWSAIVSGLAGVAFLVKGAAADRTDARPTGFWWHVASGLAIGGAIVYFCHQSDWDFAVLSVAGLLYVGLANRLGRSSWAVLGAAGLLAAAVHYGGEWSDVHVHLFSDLPTTYRHWVPPLVLAFLGFLYVFLGLVSRRRQLAE